MGGELILRKSILSRTLNIFVIGALTFLGIHLLNKSPDHGGIATLESPQVTDDQQPLTGEELDQEASLHQQIDIRGRIVKISNAEEGQAGISVLGFIMVEGLSGEGGEMRASVTIKETTLILGRTSESDGRKGFTDLNLGQLVEVSFKGPIMQSHPIRAVAEEVVIVYENK